MSPTTDWYSPDQEPEHVGVYERLYSGPAYAEPVTAFAYWSGNRWGIGMATTADAFAFSDCESLKIKRPWRGLTGPSA
jgi:hypothetical protein